MCCVVKGGRRGEKVCEKMDKKVIMSAMRRSERKEKGVSKALSPISRLYLYPFDIFPFSNLQKFSSYRSCRLCVAPFEPRTTQPTRHLHQTQRTLHHQRLQTLWQLNEYVVESKTKNAFQTQFHFFFFKNHEWRGQKDSHFQNAYSK